jgi:hypothetical protein
MSVTSESVNPLVLMHNDLARLRHMTLSHRQLGFEITDSLRHRETFFRPVNERRFVEDVPLRLV